MGQDNIGGANGTGMSRVMTPSAMAGLSCTLPPADAAERRGATTRLFDKAIRCEWTSTGARVMFHGSTEMAQAVMQFVLVERVCCAELTYEVESMPPHDHIALTMRGPQDLRDGIHAWVGKER